jgi:hypothetical protein
MSIETVRIDQQHHGVTGDHFRMDALVMDPASVWEEALAMPPTMQTPEPAPPTETNTQPNL